MKINILFTTLSLIAATGICQVNVGNAETPSAVNKGGDLEKEDIEKLKTTTVVCVLQDKEKSKLAEYRKAAAEAWNFNKIEFATQSDYSKYAGKTGYSFFTLGGIVIDRNGGASTANFFLKLWYPYEKKGKMKRKNIAQINLYLDPSSSGELIHGGGDKDDKSESLVSDKSVFYNLSPGYMKCYFAIINKCLKEEKKHYLYEEDLNEKLLKGLAKDTLFIPDYVLLGNGMKTGKMRDVKELLEKYEYPYKIVSSDALSSKALNAKRTTYIFSYIYFSSQKFLTIYEAQTGFIVYSSYEGMSMNGLNDGDFKDLSKKIKKG